MIATAAAFAWPAVQDLLVADGRIAHGHLWRAVTGPFVHATWGHLVRDLALVCVAGVAYEAPLGRKGLVFGGGLVLPGLAVLAAGQAQWYCGLSGLSHALLAAALTFEATRRTGAVRVAVLGVCAIAALKPLYELVTGAPAFAMALGADVHQTPLAHAVGVAIGVCCGLTSTRMRDRSYRSREPRAVHP